MACSDLDRLRSRLLANIRTASIGPVAPFSPPGEDGGWSDIDYGDNTRSNWKPREHLARTRQLALSVELGNASPAPALAAIGFWLKHDPLSLNWWHNQIGTPRVLGECLLLLGTRLPAALLESARPILDRADDTRVIEPSGSRPMQWTGANLLWIAANRLISGTLFADESRIEKSIAAAFGEIRLAGPGEEGIQVDGSFHQHGPLLYNGGYGCAFLAECAFFLDVAHDTRWQTSEKTWRLITDFVLDGTRWMLRGDTVNPGCRDREITRARGCVADPAFLAVFRFLADLCPVRQTELRDLAAAMNALQAPGEIDGNRMFYRSDFMVQHSDVAGLSVRMSSVRTVRAECVNEEGLLSHHLSDGLTYLFATGREYQDIFPVWDWQKLPGTTCRQQTAPTGPVAGRGGSELVGGVSDGQYGACTLEIANAGIRARKSWFFGPSGMLCLGAGIHGLTPGPVLTSLDQSLLQGPVFHDQTADPLASGTHTLRSVRWLSHGRWGFVFPQPTTLHVTTGPQYGAWSRIGTGSAEPVARDVFLATIDHGELPAEAAYAYQVVPDSTSGSLATRSSAPDVRILANTSAVRAAWWPAARLLQATFSEAASVTWSDGQILGVDQPCCVQLRTDDRGASTLGVAELRQAGATIQVTLHDSTGALRKQIALAMPSGIRAGASVITPW
jgi:chondroitin AC lyase